MNILLCRKVYPCATAPTKGAPLLSPWLKPGVLRGGGDKKNLQEIRRHVCYNIGHKKTYLDTKNSRVHVWCTTLDAITTWSES